MIKPRVLFVCTENACRSQMAEGFLRHHAADRFEAFSGGAEVGTLNPTAVDVMREVGIDISGHRSKMSPSFWGRTFTLLSECATKLRKPAPFFRERSGTLTGAWKTLPQ